MVALEVAKTSAEIAYTNINLVTGCIIVIAALSGTVVFLYKRLEALNKEFRDELKSSNETLINLNKSYNHFVSKLDMFIDLKKER